MGAGVIAYLDFMEKSAETVKGDFDLLPSSLHEVLLVPNRGDTDSQTIENMVHEVNETQVSPEDRLSDNVYHYIMTVRIKSSRLQRNLRKEKATEKWMERRLFLKISINMITI